jgi:hypothetical protein
MPERDPAPRDTDEIGRARDEDPNIIPSDDDEFDDVDEDVDEEEANDSSDR